MRTPPNESLQPLLTPESPSLCTPVLSPDHPTLLLFECVLAYMQPSESQAVIQWFVDYFSTPQACLGGVVYEMFQLNDSFGRVMLNNMKASPFRPRAQRSSPNKRRLGAKRAPPWCGALYHERLIVDTLH